MRIKWIDIAKGITILCVIYGHAVQVGILNTALYMFRMPLFFVMSGYLFNRDKWLYNGRGLVKNRFKRLMVPYFMMAVITNGINIIYLLSQPGDYKEEILSKLLGVLYGSHGWLSLGVLWFLPCLFVSELIFWAVLRLFKERLHLVFPVAIILSVLGFYISKMIELPWSVDISLVSQTFLACGYMMKAKELVNRLNKSFTIMAFAIYLLILIYNGLVDMNTRVYGNLLLFLSGGVVGTLLICKISMFLAANSRLVTKALSFCGQESLIFLLFHMDIIYYFRRFFFWSKFGLNSEDIIIYDVYVVLATGIGIVVPLLIARYLTEFYIFRLISGRPRY